ncbi:MAG: methyltransferase [Proteobacteria bacterium]|nr:methyltransferase [Pseudomonadota bacterium]MBU1688342.1 methyltransferase [Pseudomonadota bacterium]
MSEAEGQGLGRLAPSPGEADALASFGRGEAVEAFCRGRVFCRQLRGGYRFTQDAVILAGFVRPGPGEKVLDLGCGCGVIGLILAGRWPKISVHGLEIQPALAELARRNVADSGLSNRLTITHGDLRLIRELYPQAGFQRVVANPPYFPLGKFRPNSSPELAVARHELCADLPAVIRAMDWVLDMGGYGDLVLPAWRLEQAAELLREYGFKLVCLQTVHEYPGAPGGVVLIEAVKGEGGERTTLPPFHVRLQPGGDYTPEMSDCYF